MVLNGESRGLMGKVSCEAKEHLAVIHTLGTSLSSMSNIYRDEKAEDSV